MNDDKDLDIQNYSSDDLYDLCNLEKNASAKEILERTDFYIERYQADERLSDFFVKVQHKLLSSESFTIGESFNTNQEEQDGSEDDDEEEYGSAGSANASDVSEEYSSDVESGEKELFVPSIEESNNQEKERNDSIEKGLEYINDQNNTSSGWLSSNFGARGQQDPVRPPNVQFAMRDGGNDAMRQNYLGVQQNFSVPYAQGVLNPNTHNKIVSLMNIDSKFRPFPDGKFIGYPQFGCSTNFSINMTEEVHNVMSIKLESYEIPYTWLEIDSKKGNNKFSYTTHLGDVICVDISQGIPTLDGVRSSISEAEPSPGSRIDMSLNEEGYVTLTNNRGFDISINFWGDDFRCERDCTALTVNKQSTLGWLLGFRQESYHVPYNWPQDNFITAEAHPYWSNPEGIRGSTTKALSDWKLRHVNSCLYIVLDDNQRNRSNKGVINITPADTTLSVPSYFSCDLCNNPVNTLPDAIAVNRNSGLTRAQLYSLYVINENRKKNSKSNIASGANDIDILGKISLGNKSYGEMYSDDKVSDTYTRNYLGPVNLDKFTVRLIDDHGNLVNLANADWSFSLQVERLYQY